MGRWSGKGGVAVLLGLSLGITLLLTTGAGAQNDLKLAVVDISAVFNSPFVSAYWPLLLGGPIVFLTMAKGIYWVAVPLTGLTLLAQAWHVGMLE